MSDKITDRQLALLCDLAALEEAKLIHPGSEVLAHSGYDEGSTEVEVPGVTTHSGQAMVAEFKRSGRTIFP